MADIKTRQSNKGTIRTIDRASAIAASNDEPTVSGCDDKLLAPSLQVWQPQTVNLRVLAHRTNQDVGLLHAQCRLQIGFQTAYGNLHALIVLLTIADGACRQSNGIRLR